ncbi:hypothetical protein BU24DRAFT_455749 [Aaosphaeria arxii CBS 175.79]|uniref:Uncharacterized protein n=1 Tax=Aaosphaeria arxii CBS 175.79 TaxID=1450172 RepID=A0A6A5X8I5_9PLEO|nr:uncharacterized protein BU24DRAFT_455749 [Aaosphaeria arxii CBS 175.79]KAF2009209.1 hypothetical protein BU24DRAFT_455749 [Aaosphaeria arxii CBS 175.79]
MRVLPTRQPPITPYTLCSYCSLPASRLSTRPWGTCGAASPPVLLARSFVWHRNLPSASAEGLLKRRDWSTIIMDLFSSSTSRSLEPGHRGLLLALRLHRKPSQPANPPPSSLTVCIPIAVSFLRWAMQPARYYPLRHHAGGPQYTVVFQSRPNAPSRADPMQPPGYLRVRLTPISSPLLAHTSLGAQGTVSSDLPHPWRPRAIDGEARKIFELKQGRLLVAASHRTAYGVVVREKQ